MAKASKKKGRKGDDEVKKSKKKGKAAREIGEAVFDPYAMYNTSLDDVEKKFGLASDLMEDIPPMSTGNLGMDIMYGGGIRPAMVTHSGQEQTCKTTGAYVIMASMVKQKVPILAFWDAEGSGRSGKRYIGNIVRTVAGLKTKHVFGKKDEDGRWSVKPTVRFFPESRGEKFFDWLAHLLRTLPDKRFVNGKWWLIYEDTKENKAKFSEHADSSMPKKYGKGIWVEAPDGNLQAVIFVDSLPALNPPSNDEDEADNSLGVHARFYSKHLPRVKGRFAPKMVALVAINQLSDIPMAMYGPKEQEKCGKAVRFYSDARLWWQSRSSGMPFNPSFDKEEGLEIEDSVEFEGGQDRYRYVQAKAKKNKLATPGRKVWMRVWTDDGEGEARGFCPVFDVAQYLQLTGQLTAKGGRKKIVLNLHKLGESSMFDWKTLKHWVLGDTDTMRRMSKKVGYDKPFDLRKFCFNQSESGLGNKLYNKARKAKTEENDDDE